MQNFFPITVFLWICSFIFLLLSFNESLQGLELKVVSAIICVGLLIFYTYFSINYFLNIPFSEFSELFKSINWNKSLKGVIIGMPFATAAATGSLVVYDFPMIMLLPVTCILSLLGFIVVKKELFIDSEIKNNSKFIIKNYILLVAIITIQSIIIVVTWPRYSLKNFDNTKTHINLSGSLGKCDSKHPEIVYLIGADILNLEEPLGKQT